MDRELHHCAFVLHSGRWPLKMGRKKKIRPATLLNKRLTIFSAIITPRPAVSFYVLSITHPHPYHQLITLMVLLKRALPVENTTVNTIISVWGGLMVREITRNAIEFLASVGAILYQHFFWLFGHPEVYTLVLVGGRKLNRLALSHQYGYFACFKTPVYLKLLTNVLKFKTSLRAQWERAAHNPEVRGS